MSTELSTSDGDPDRKPTVPPQKSISYVIGDWGNNADTLKMNIEKRSTVLQKLRKLRELDARCDTGTPWIKSYQAETLFAGAIIASALLTGIDVEIAVRPYHVPTAVEGLLLAGRVLFIVLFIVELALHILADGWKYILPCNPAGCFDAVVITVSAVEAVIAFTPSNSAVLRAAGALRILRLLRLARIARVLLVSKELKLITVGIFSSLSTVMWTFVLISVMMYVGALGCVILLGREESLSEYFGSVWMGLYTHFMIITLEAWPDISDSVMDTSSALWACYFIVFICVTSLAVMNLVTGIIGEKLLNASDTLAAVDLDAVHQDEVAAFQKLRSDFKQELGDLFKAISGCHATDVDFSTFADLFENEQVRQLLERYKISVDIESSEMYTVIADGSAPISWDGFCDGLFRLRNSWQRPHSLILQHQLTRTFHQHHSRVLRMESKIGDSLTRGFAEAEEELTAKLDALSLLAEAPLVEKPSDAKEWEADAERMLRASIQTLDALIASGREPACLPDLVSRSSQTAPDGRDEPRRSP